MAAKNENCSQIVVAAYVTVSAYRGNVALAGNYLDFVNTLIAGKAPVTLVSLGNPYLVRSFPNVARLSDHLQSDANLRGSGRARRCSEKSRSAAGCR